MQLVDERGKTRLTTHEILEAERTLATAADGLASQRRDVAIARRRIDGWTNSSNARMTTRRMTTRD